jgi:hypothetical protein
VVFETGGALQPVEVKSGATFVRDWLKGPRKWASIAGEGALPAWLIYGGDERFASEGIQVLPWRDLGELSGRP